MFSTHYRYKSLPNDQEDQQRNISEIIHYRIGYLCKNIAFLISTIIILLWSIHFLQDIDINTLGGLGSKNSHTSDELWLRYGWWSKYSTDDHLNSTAVSEVDQAWDEIIPGHGVVALDHRQAAAQGLPASMDLPSNDSKGVYIIDAYHQIHCLTIIRKTWYQMQRGQEVTWPAAHTIHCFDALRQYITCTAGDTLLYTMGRNKTGDGQFRKCRDWSALRDWATEHTACYRDSEKSIPLEDHFGHCDGGVDGIAWSREE